MYNICKSNVSWNGWVDGYMDEWQAREITRGKNRIKCIDKIYLYKLLLWFSLWNISSHLQYCYTIYFSKCYKDIIYNMSKTYVPVCTSRYKPTYRHIHMYICDFLKIFYLFIHSSIFLFICYVSYVESWMQVYEHHKFHRSQMGVLVLLEPEMQTSRYRWSESKFGF